MKRLSMMLLTLLLLLWGLAVAQPSPPTLVMQACEELSADPDGHICVPVILENRGARVASVGFSLEYDCQVLWLPNGSRDVQRGSVLTGGQDVTVIVEEDKTCQVKVAVTPPIKVPIPTIPPGELVRICFMIKAYGPRGCRDITFVPGSVDMGDDRGRNLEIGMSINSRGVGRLPTHRARHLHRRD